MTDSTVSIVSGEGDVRGDAYAGPCLFLLFECGRPLAMSTRHRLRELDEVTIGRAPARQYAREYREDGARVLTLGVPDPRMSQPHARLVVEMGRWILEDAGSKNGVVLNGERHQRAVLEDGDLFDLGHSIFLFRDPTPYDELELDRDGAELRAPAPGLATFVPALRRTFEDLAQVAATPAPVLILGETGAGKEVVARAIRDMSKRPGPFVAVNCGALPGTLVESELFGHKKGAFTGATEDHKGLVRTAHEGTLFLDEIGDLSFPSQAALLRVLQEREVTPVGETRPYKVDLKLVAATHHDLQALVAADRFRQDLYARIAAFVVRLPPLRERREDLGLLIAAILGRTGAAPAFSIEAGRALMRYDWPRNVRELDSTLGIALALSRGGTIGLAHLPEPVRETRPAPPPPHPPSPPPPHQGGARRARGGKQELEQLLQKHEGNISAIARELGISRIHVHRLLQRDGLDPDKYRLMRRAER